MNVSCNIIEDILPLYADGICSEDSRALVDEHTEGCPQCKAKLDAMIAKLDAPPPVGEMEKTKLFCVLHKQYVRLGIVTLVICAAVLIPAAILGILYVNEETHQGVSFSTIELVHDMQKFGNKLKKGEYRAALDTIHLTNEEDYTETQLSAYKDTIAADLEKYIAEYHIRGLRYYTRYVVPHGERIIGDTIIILEDERGNSPEISLCFEQSGESIVLSFVECGVYRRTDYFFGLYTVAEPLPSDVVEGYSDFFRDVPNILLPEADFAAEKTFSQLNCTNDINYYSIISMEKFLSFNYDEENFYPNLRKYFESLPIREFAEKYIYIDCQCGLPQYTSDDEWGRYYIQQADLRFIADEKTVTVSCKLPFDKSDFPFRLYAVQDIVYSENAPQDFRDTFERIFGE